MYFDGGVGGEGGQHLQETAGGGVPPGDCRGGGAGHHANLADSAPPASHVDNVHGPALPRGNNIYSHVRQSAEISIEL